MVRKRIYRRRVMLILEYISTHGTPEWCTARMSARESKGRLPAYEQACTSCTGVCWLYAYLLIQSIPLKHGLPLLVYYTPTPSLARDLHYLHMPLSSPPPPTLHSSLHKSSHQTLLNVSFHIVIFKLIRLMLL